MSVILGYKAEGKIYLAADNRTVTLEEVLSRDDVNKIVVVNNDVAVAFAGYGGTQKLFESMIKDNTKDFKVDDAIVCIKRIYWLCKFLWFKKGAKNVLYLGSRFIVAGKNKKGECCMYTVSFLHGKLEQPSLTDRFIFPPFDADAKLCCDIYARNVINHRNDFIQRTIKDIAKISNVISPSGDIWIYDMKTGKSTSEHFS